MKNNIKNIIICVIFCLFVFGFFVACLLHKPVEYSESERKPLAQFPEINVGTVLDKTAIQGFDKYSAEQFPLREQFLDIYRWYRRNIFKTSSVNIVNGYGEKDGYVAKVDTKLDEALINNAIEKFNKIYDKYIKASGGKVYYSVIPMKDHFFSEKYNTLSLNEKKLLSMLEDGLDGFEYIDIISLLALEDYYKTDTHWSQDKVLDIRDKLLTTIGGADEIKGEYITEKFEGFEGAYFAYAPVSVSPDTIYYLTSDVINDLKVFDVQFDNTGKLVVKEFDGVYNTAAFDSKEPYDLFLYGVRPYVRIENPNAATDKEIIVFRDSFSSSLAPLLAEGYSKVHLIDLRNIPIDMIEMLSDELSFENKDVLFLYSTELLNSNVIFHAMEK